MRKSCLTLLVMLSLVLVVSSFVADASADMATVGNVWTTDENVNSKVVFSYGEAVHIHWTANGQVDITVYGPDGTTIDEQWNNQPSSGVVSFVPSLGDGIYAIYCTGASSRLVAIGTFSFTVPEIPMGAVTALLLSLAALALFKKRSLMRRM